MKTGAKQMEQQGTEDLKARIKKLLAEKKTYREIAQLEHISIAQISRIQKQLKEEEAGLKSQISKDYLDEEASNVFELLEEGLPLPEVVIALKMNPDKVKQLYDKWTELKEIDINQPTVLKQIKELDDSLTRAICILSKRDTEIRDEIMRQIQARIRAI